MRADKFIAQTLNISRNQASELIAAKSVLANGFLVLRASQELGENDKIELSESVYVSRAALKLKSYLKTSGFSVLDLSVLDAGCSTGGFMQVLLENGAKSVLGIDVGRAQISAQILKDTRANVLEETDIRGFISKDKFDLITCDVSFISLNLVLEALYKNLKDKGAIIALFKPQFEVGKEAKRNKKGVVTDERAIDKAMRDFELNSAKIGLIIKDKRECEVRGKEGNVEYFYHLVRP